MYDELVKRLRYCSEETSGCGLCTLSDNCVLRVRLILQAANAIEALSREVEEYKSAYHKEHNKRIAENRHLYDELTKAVRAKLLMTPMRIEVPQPPKGEV